MAVVEDLEGPRVAVADEAHHVLVGEALDVGLLCHPVVLRVRGVFGSAIMPGRVSARTPAQLYALVVGLALVAGGVVGFFYNASFATGDEVEREAVLGILDVNAWHNLVHIATGAVALLLVGSYSASRAFAIVFGAVYLLVAILGFIVGDGEVIVGLVPVNTEDNVLHVLIALAGLLAFASTPAVPPPTTVESPAT